MVELVGFDCRVQLVVQLDHIVLKELVDQFVYILDLELYGRYATGARDVLTHKGPTDIVV
jgi:hypothetical protein